MLLSYDPATDWERGMSLVPEKHKSITGRSLEVTRIYLQRGQAVSRSLWIKASPKNPLLKAAVALPIGAVMLMMLFLILIALGFTLMAVALMSALSRREGNTEGG